jgi:hypothetical protein
MPHGTVIRSLDRRRFTETPENRARSLELMEIKRHGKPVVVFSTGDLTAGLANVQTWGIFGYAPKTVAKIAWNALIYLQPPFIAVPQPEPAVNVAGAQGAAGTLAGNPAPRPQNLADVYSALTTPLNLLSTPR